METVRIPQIPACNMVASLQGMFGDDILEAFSEWFGQFDRDVAANRWSTTFRFYSERRITYED